MAPTSPSASALSAAPPPARPRVPISPLFDIVRGPDGQDRMEVAVDGVALLRLVLINKGTAFTREERVALGLDGLLPPQVNDLELQVARAYRAYCGEPTRLAKYQYLRALQERQEILFHALLAHHLEEMLPVVYTPTVGEAVQKFSALYQNPRGMSLSPENIDRADEILARYPLNDVHMIVATDSSAILGIGDQGWGGLAIPIGKLALYTCAGGVSPFHTMPVALDVGTDRDDLLADPLYLGTRRRRLRGDAYLDFFERFVRAVARRWPRAVIQWEDLAKDSAFTVLERFRDQHPSFNDDIQGTGAVALAGLTSAARLIGRPLRDQVGAATLDSPAAVGALAAAVRAAGPGGAGGLGGAAVLGGATGPVATAAGAAAGAAGAAVGAAGAGAGAAGAGAGAAGAGVGVGEPGPDAAGAGVGVGEPGPDAALPTAESTVTAPQIVSAVRAARTPAGDRRGRP